MASSSSSSSEDEEERKIMAEIADCAAKDLSQALARKVDTENKNSVVSKRAEKDYDDQGAEKSSLTPECKRHLAKKLSSYLDSCIQIETGYTLKPKEMMTQESGIQLFCSSRNMLLDMENEIYLREKKSKTPKRPPKSYSSSGSSDNEDDLAKFQEAAVCGKSIIDQSGLSTEKSAKHRENSSKNKKKKKQKKQKEQKTNNKDCSSEYKFEQLKDRWKEKCQSS